MRLPLLRAFALRTALSAAPSFEVATIRLHQGEIAASLVDVHGTFVNVFAMTVREW